MSTKEVRYLQKTMTVTQIHTSLVLQSTDINLALSPELDQTTVAATSQIQFIKSLMDSFTIHNC